jgi:two-component system OmpR family sensor kinase
MQGMSIKSRLSLGFFLFLFLVVFLGVFNIICLTDFNDVANQIGTRWLPSTRFLGDLNNYTSDFRAAEGTLLLSATPSGIATSEREMRDLAEAITKANRSLHTLPAAVGSIPRYYRQDAGTDAQGQYGRKHQDI